MSELVGRVSILSSELKPSHLKLSKTASQEERNLFLDESLFLSRVHHPNVVKLVNCGIEDSGRPFIETEKLFQSSGTNDISGNSRRFGDDLVSILNVFDFLAFLNLSHGDIKPEHLLRDTEGNLILIDFAQVYSLSRKVLIGTSAYLAPELFWNHGYSLQSDMFSFGLSLVQLHYPNEIVNQLINKYGSSLKPWTSDDVNSLRKSIDDSEALGKCLQKMLSYSPLERPNSGKDVATTLIASGESNWSLEQYDKLIIEALKYYIDRTHWIYRTNVLFRKTRDLIIRVKNCHDHCLASFANNFELIYEFVSEGNSKKLIVLPDKRGMSICRQKYFRGHIPRILPKSVAIPSSIDTVESLSSKSSLGALKLDYDFHICYTNSCPRNVALDAAVPRGEKDFDFLKELAMCREYSMGLRMVEFALKSAKLSNEEKLILKSYKGYFLTCLGKVDGAKELFESIPKVEKHTVNYQTLAEYYSCLGSHLFLTGDSKSALTNLENASQILEKDSLGSNLFKAVTYNRLASVKWLVEGVNAAIKFNDKAIAHASATGNNLILVPILLNRCMYFGDSGNLTAEKQVQASLYEKMIGVQNRTLIINYLHNCAAFCFRLGEIEKALSLIKRAYSFAITENESNKDLPHLQSLLGNIIMRGKETTRAARAWDLAAHGLLNSGNIYLAGKCTQNLAEVNFLSGNSSKAQRLLKLANRLINKAGHELGCCETSLIVMMHADSKDLNLNRIRELYKKYEKASHVWGQFHTLWLSAICELSKRRWSNFNQTFGKMNLMANKMAQDSVLEDLKLLKSIANQLRSLNKEQEVENSFQAFFEILRKRGADSLRDNRAMIIGLMSEGNNIFDDKRSLKLLIREMEIEGKIMGSDNHRRSLDDSGTVKDKSQDNVVKGSVLERFEVIKQIAGLVDQSKNVDEYVTKVLDLTVKTLGASRGAIFITSKYSEDVEILGIIGCKSEDISDIKNISKSLLRHALGGNSIFIRNTTCEVKYEELQSLIAKRIKSAICIPLKKDKEVFGAVYVDSLHFSTVFEDLDKSFLDTFGAMISGGISTSYRLQRLNSDYQHSLKQENEIGLRSFEGLLLPSQEMQDIYKLIFKISKTNFPVLLLGQTGSGKDVLARMIHDNSELLTGRFVAINCSAIPSEHLESELFGVAGKAFTDVSERKGRFELADNGTLFLDEIAEMPLSLQAKLLRVIETKDIEPVGGGGETRKVSFRLISATNKNLKQMVSDGKFREDLYHRINDLIIKIPDLAQRPKDIEVLAHHYHSFFHNKLNVKSGPLSERVLNSLLKYNWPGGIRELAKVIQNIVAFSDGSAISLKEFPDAIKEALLDSSQIDVANLSGKTLGKEQLLSTLRKTNYNIREAARMIQIPESTLRYQLKKLNIEPLPKRLRA